MAGICLGVLMATIDFSIVNVSLPTLVAELETDFATIQWVVLAYVLIITSLMLGAARLGDMYGEKRLYTAGMLVFVGGSLLCGLAPGAGWLIGFRALQGLGAAFMQALGVAIITQIFPPTQRGRALGVLSAVVSVGLSLGPALGGVLIGFFGWRSVFLVNVPLGFLALAVVIRYVPPPEPKPEGQRFDPAGALVLCATLVCYALGMTLGQRWGFGHAGVQALLAAAAAGLGLFAAVERRAADPMVALGTFANPLLSLNLLMGFLVFACLGLQLVLPFHLELVAGLSVTQVGLMMMVVPLTMGLVAPWAGWLSDRWGPRGISLAGLLILAGGVWSMTSLSAETGMAGFVLRLAPIGMGVGFFQSPNANAVMGQAPPHRRGLTSGLFALSRTLGNTSGVPLGGALFSAQVAAVAGLAAIGRVTEAPPAALVAGVRAAFGVGFWLVVLAAVMAGAAWWLDRRRAARA
jgi:EmrB/QacA subfamily drug resistance transporter